MIKAIVKCVKALCTNTAPGEIAHALCLGAILGFLPKNNVLWYLLFIFVFFMRIQRGVYSLAVIIGTLVAPYFDPYFHAVGVYILTHPKVIPIVRYLLGIPFVAFTHFNNSIVMGSLACGLLAYIPLYILSRILTRIWRHLFAAKIKNIKFIKAFTSLPLVQKIVELAEED